MRSILRRHYDARDLARSHPPKLGHANKKLMLELTGPQTDGTIDVTRWAAESLPERMPATAPRVEQVSGYYDYAGPTDGVWHVNFADPDLFVAYGSSLLAQDELQAVEHPALGSIREALLAEGDGALTEERGEPTPVLVAGVERRCTLDTLPDLDKGRVYGLYGNHFGRASAEVVRAAVRTHRPAPRTNLIAIAAPGGGRGEYMLDEIKRITVTAYTGFAAAVEETTRMWPGSPTEIRTGFWGCGAFGGNRHLMTLLQLLAARLAGVSGKFYAFDDMGQRDFDAGAAAYARVTEGDPAVAEILERIADLDYTWGQSNGT
ncbi:MAG TPA: hypothetical protein VGM90_05250 [Kofleriaceae bacterium]|jgi:hypothetical protein